MEGSRTPILERFLLRALSAAPPTAVDRTRWLPLVAPLLKHAVTAVSRPLLGREIVIPHGEAAGLRLCVDRASLVWAAGRVELPVQQELARALRPGDVFFDVGANVGFYTLLGARAVGEAGRVVAFEPHPENVDALRRNVALNGFENVVVVPKAVSREDGVGRLVGRDRATARLVPQGHTRAGAAAVETIALGGFVETHRDLEPAVVKIDVEGHELEVVAGLARVLARSSPVVVCELHGTARQLQAELERVGYECRGLGGTRLEPASTHLVATRA